MKISKIFTTLDGECTNGGPLQWAVFVRLMGCSLRCWFDGGYCDAPHTLSLKDAPNGSWRFMSPKDVAEYVSLNTIQRVVITGGEPLDQEDEVIELSKLLHDYGKTVMLETSGAYKISDRRWIKTIIADVKLPSSRMHNKNNYHFHGSLLDGDFIKGVASSFEDLEYMKEYLGEYVGYDFARGPSIAVGPRYDVSGNFMLQPKEIVDWMGKNQLYSWRLNLQMHKHIWSGPVEFVTDLSKLDYGKYNQQDK